MKHTKGPWEINEKKECIFHEEDGFIAISPEVYATLLGKKITTNWEANARLIAASPKMYEALKKVLEWENHNCKQKGCEKGCPYEDAYLVLEEARGEG